MAVFNAPDNTVQSLAKLIAPFWQPWQKYNHKTCSSGNSLVNSNEIQA